MPISLFSVQFFLFLACSLIITFILPYRLRLFSLFVFSSVFIALFHWSFLLIAYLCAFVNYTGGKQIANSIHYRKYWFWICQSFNFGLIIFYKFLIGLLPYSFWSNEARVIQFFLLPLGFSYYLFQSISYLYLIYKGVEKPEKSWLNFFIYIVFFPKFIAGPIERAKGFLLQLKSGITFSADNFIQGGRLFLWGALKKVFVANTLGLVVNKVHGDPSAFDWIPTLLAFVLHSSYIYFDFSGYTDMALGLGRCFGIRLSENFNLPFKAQTVAEFWRRWHISLSSWCNDFIYNPIMLRYRRMKNGAVVLAISLTFIVIGLWHGATFNFFILGVLQAGAIIFEFFTKRYRNQLSNRFPPFVYRFFSMFVVNLFFSVSLVFFYSKNLDNSFQFLDQLFAFHIGKTSFWGLNIPRVEFLVAILGAVFIYFVEYGPTGLFQKLMNYFVSQRALRWTLYWISIAIVVFYSKNSIVFSYAGF